MQSNKVSEKVVWDNCIPSDNDSSTQSASQMNTQQQMMFCYKCSNVIPGDSVYCPYCQIKLFTECPKCGAKYSSQYPVCNQCGTNRHDYYENLRRERERKEAIERENRKQKEIKERQRLEEERRKKEAEEERKRQQRIKAAKQREFYNKENEEIKNTQEYELTYTLIKEAWELTIENNKKWKRINIIYFTILFILCVPTALLPVFFAILSLILICGSLPLVFIANYFTGDKYCNKIILRYITDYDDCYRKIITTEIIQKIRNAEDEKSLKKICLIICRKKNRLVV